MAEQGDEPAGVFPTDDSLCERCGYPIKGLALDADCPECGQAIADSSPALRTGFRKAYAVPLKSFFDTAPRILRSPKRSFREMQIDGNGDRAKMCLDFVAFTTALLWCMLGYPALPYQTDPLRVFLLTWVGVYLLTHLEMLGVTAVCKRRGWRVNYKLAQRVCCYASVGWLPGVLIAAAGVWLLNRFAMGHLWFTDMMGLVRVSWVFYGLLFVSSLLWFETLVWIGVRQVRYANAWPALGDDAPSTAQDPGIS